MITVYVLYINIHKTLPLFPIFVSFLLCLYKINPSCQHCNCIVCLHRYDRVVDVCSLRPDLEILPYGDQTEVGAFQWTSVVELLILTLSDGVERSTLLKCGFINVITEKDHYPVSGLWSLSCVLRVNIWKPTSTSVMKFKGFCEFVE